MSNKSAQHADFMSNNAHAGTGQPNKQYRVLVLGAGISGLACAKELSHRGYKVLVVEARDRVGGRLKAGSGEIGGLVTSNATTGSIVTTVSKKNSSKSRGTTTTTTTTISTKTTTTPVDVGGALIHGINNNPVYKIAQQIGVPTYPVSDCLLFDGSGWPVDARQDEKVSTIFNECLDDTFKRVKKELQNSDLSSDEHNKNNSNNNNNNNNSVNNNNNNKNNNNNNSVNNNNNNSVITIENSDKKSNSQSLTGESAVDSSTAAVMAATTSATAVATAGTAAATTTTATAAAAIAAPITATTSPAATAASNSHDEVSPAVVAAAAFATAATKKDDSDTTINDSVPAAASVAVATMSSSNTGKSFGDLFESVCKEKSSSKMRQSPLFNWHKVNLEVSCGASFNDLGYTWNDDEPFGYSGDHVALGTSWNAVTEALSEGLDIMYSSPVKHVNVVADPYRGVSAAVAASAAAGANADEKTSTTLTPAEESNSPKSKRESMVNSGKSPTNIEKRLPRRTKKKVTTGLLNKEAIKSLLPTRRSRRIKGEDTQVRRSSRVTKGIIIDRFCVTDHTSLTYHGSSSAYKQLRQDSKRKQTPQSFVITKETHNYNSSASGYNDKFKRRKDTIASSTTVVQVTLQDGTVLEADFVICTLPLGIMKLSIPSMLEKEDKGRDQNDQKQDKLASSNNEVAAAAAKDEPAAIRFYPPLSERKQLAIQRLGCGVLNKCALSFSYVFWQDSDFLGLASNSHSPYIIPAASAAHYNNTSSYLILNAAKYTDKPILVFMYGGSFAKEIESWTDKEIIEDCLKVLKTICRSNIPNPLDYIITRWGEEQYSRMAFSYVPPGVNGTQEQRIVSEPVHDPALEQLDFKKPVLMFAGEHTTPYHPSTIHGAFLSGIREAYRLDLFMEPRANGNLAFMDDQLYQHTFPVKRKFRNNDRSKIKGRPPKTALSPKRKEAIVSDVAGSSTQESEEVNRPYHRRRGAAGVMTLRGRPKAINYDESNDVPLSSPGKKKRIRDDGDDDDIDISNNNAKSQKVSAAPSSPTPQRRSQRSLNGSINRKPSAIMAPAAAATTNGVHFNGDGSALDEEEDEVVAAAKAKRQQQQCREHRISLERRSISRAMESYGLDYPYIASTILPVYDGANTNGGFGANANATKKGSDKFEDSKEGKKSIAQIRARCQQLLRYRPSPVNPSLYTAAPSSPMFASSSSALQSSGTYGGESWVAEKIFGISENDVPETSVPSAATTSSKRPDPKEANNKQQIRKSRRTVKPLSKLDL